MPWATWSRGSFRCGRRGVNNRDRRFSNLGEDWNREAGPSTIETPGLIELGGRVRQDSQISRCSSICPSQALPAPRWCTPNRSLDESLSVLDPHFEPRLRPCVRPRIAGGLRAHGFAPTKGMLSNGREVNRRKGRFPLDFFSKGSVHGAVVNSWRKDTRPMDPTVITGIEELPQWKV